MPTSSPRPRTRRLRGPRGGLVLCDRELAEHVDRGCPLVLGGPLPHVMAAKAVALAEASQPAFADYAAAVVDNARVLADGLIAAGVPVVTGGTDNHLVLVDVRPFGLNGRQAEAALRAAGITLNRNVVPDETNGAWYTSGLRLGTRRSRPSAWAPTRWARSPTCSPPCSPPRRPVSSPQGRTRASRRWCSSVLDEAVASAARCPGRRPARPSSAVSGDRAVTIAQPLATRRTLSISAPPLLMSDSRNDRRSTRCR